MSKIDDIFGAVPPREAAITADSTWERAQSLEHASSHELEIQVSGVLALSIDQNNQMMMYVNLGSRQNKDKADWYRITNIKGLDEVTRL